MLRFYAASQPTDPTHSLRSYMLRKCINTQTQRLRHFNTWSKCHKTFLVEPKALRQNLVLCQATNLNRQNLSHAKAQILPLALLTCWTLIDKVIYTKVE